ncbi:MAG TPA: ADOP family duplicated permease, partial [Vicinamibacterales bacterium]|nr:ADOP family duplicated permease [Vicinamibacterales bacterium]
MLRKAPGFAAAATVTLALGIGVTTTLVSVAYGVLLKPLPWPQPERLVRLTETRGGQAGRVAGTISNATYLAWREHFTTVEELGGWVRSQPMTLDDGHDPIRVPVTPVTPSLFTVLHATPQLGRLPIADDLNSSGAALATRVILLSYGLWQERFGGRADAIGRTIRLDNQTVTVVGVMPRTFAFPTRETRAWTPFNAVAVEATIRGERVIRAQIFSALARLTPGETAAQAAAEGTARALGAPDLETAATALFGSSGPPKVIVESAVHAMTADVRPAILLLLAGALLLLLTATANVASLQLARAVARRREMAIRRAIGAGTGRITRQLIVESAIVGMLGAAGGLALAAVLIRIAPSILPADFPRLDDVAVDWHVGLAAAAAAVLASTACGLLPAIHVRRESLVGSFASHGSASAASWLRAVHMRTAIMIGQVAVACVLLAGAGLLGRSFIARLHADRGYEPANVLTAALPFPRSYPPARRVQIIDAVLARMRALPGVRVAAFGNALPYVSAGGFRGQKMRMPRDPSREMEVQWMNRVVSPEYFAALRLHLVAGRPLTDADTATSPSVVVVNRSFAKKYLSDRAVGDTLSLMLRDDRHSAEVVGVVDDVRQGDVTAPDQPEIFESYRQVAETVQADGPILVIRTAADLTPYIGSLRSVLRDQDASVPLDSIMTMDDRIATSLARPRTYAALFGVFAAGALAIAGVGLFGLLAHTVAQRTREIGIRIALGALRGQITVLVLRHAVIVVSAGLLVGLGASLALGTLLRSFLYGVTTHDPSTFLAVIAILAAIAVASCLLPLRRALLVDPVVALRVD